MTKEEALDAMWMRCQHNDKTFEAYCILKRAFGLIELGGEDRVKTELKPELNELELCNDAISRKATVERLCKVAEFMNERRSGLGSPYIMAALFIQDNKDEFPPVRPKQTECENAISRQAVLDIDFKRIILTTAKPAEMIEQKVKALPSVTPAGKVGRWKPYDGSWYECSECGAIREAVGFFENYCPNCGAKMEVTDGISN